jgi:hypothetical protein
VLNTAHKSAGFLLSTGLPPTRAVRITTTTASMTRSTLISLGPLVRSWGHTCTLQLALALAHNLTTFQGIQARVFYILDSWLVNYPGMESEKALFGEYSLSLARLPVASVPSSVARAIVTHSRLVTAH